MIVEQQSRLARRRRALERRCTDTDDRAAVCEGGKDVAESFGTHNGIVLVATFSEAGRGLDVVIGAEGDN